MKNILLIGVGGTGSKAVDIFFQKCKELGNQTGNNITALVFDTDAGDLKKIQAAKTVVMADNASVGTICDRFGKEFLKEWFPSEDKAVRAQEMIRGASQWRKKSYLAFLNLMNKPLARSTFISALEEMTADPGASCEVYVIASVAGGTGSGSFIPIALYAKRYLRRTLGKDPIVNAMIALPDIYADSQTPENRIKVYANAYAILRELNAINLVARNYNADVSERKKAPIRVSEHKKAPIRFKIGDANEPSVGLLFDASDRQFWTPEAAPFSQVFLLDRIPGLNSVTAHDIVLANSLYTLLCTDIGSAFDSEFSNHELLRSQSNGSNAIFAGISTSQIRFPNEAVLDYLAHQKTLSSCESEWVMLHNATETAIREKEQQAKECNQTFTLKGYDYPKIVLEQLAELEENDNDAVISIVQRCVDIKETDENGNVITLDAVKEYMTDVNAFITSKITDKRVYEEDINGKLADIVNDGAISREDVPTCAAGIKETLLEYYCQCIDNIKRMSASTADAILTLDKKKQEYVGTAHALTDKLLKRNGKFVHPVAAVILLSRARLAIQEKLEKECDKREWSDLKKRTVDALPDNMLEVSEGGDGSAKSAKSAYLKAGKERFIELCTGDGQDYLDVKRTDVKEDVKALEADSMAILTKINRGAQSQFKARVYGAVAANLDILLAKYRTFFNRFTKEKEDLYELVKMALRKDAENIDSVINVYSSVDHKKSIYKKLIEEAGPVTDEELAKTDDVIGRGVFTTAFNSAMAEFAKNTDWNDKDSKAYKSLFTDMINAYRESIGKSERFEEVASYNVIEAMMASSGEEADQKKKDEEFKTKFSVAQDLATPSLRLDATMADADLVRPSNIMVFMMSENTARYIKKHADEFGLHLPADQTNEGRVMQSCAEEFIRMYSGNNSARVSIVSTMSDQVLYCTGEIMDITPLRIAKFNELGEDNVYFRNYSTAISNYKKYGTDMWNPHLGNDLHKRGYLPYMNQAKEHDCDVRMVKALLYGFQNGRILYKDGMGEANGKYYFECDNRKITDPEGRWINNKNIAQLLAWIRNEDEICEEWSALFDKEIKRQQNMLPSLASENSNEVKALEAALTNSVFMKLLTERLYIDATDEKKLAGKKVKADGGKLTTVKREGPTVLEFAYMIKTSEEAGRDCDDAERILQVVYDVFKDMCEYRTNPDNTPECFIQVYKQQLGKVYESLATAKTVMGAGSECRAHFKQLLTWLSQADVFNTISADTPMDEKGKVCINTLFDINDADVKRVLEYIRKGNKETEEAEEVTEASAEEIQE